MKTNKLKHKLKQLKRASKAEVRAVSGVTGQGVEQVLWDVLHHLDAEKAAAAALEKQQAGEKWTP